MESLIITVSYERHKQLAELFPITQVINLQDLDSINYFRNASCIAVVVDVDNLPSLKLDDIIKQTSRYKSKIIFTSNNEEAVEYLNTTGVAVANDQDLIANKILGIYAGANRQNYGSYIFDYETRTVTNADVVYKLQNTPFLIFNHLVKNANKACSREEMIEKLYSYEIDEGLTTINTLSDVRSIDVHIHTIRKTIPDKRIKTILNEGYMYEEKEKDIEKKK